MSVKYSNRDRYINPGTGVLFNKLGIEDEAALEAAEADLAAVRILELRRNPVKGKLDFKHLKAVHGYIFQDVYDWAGEIRDVNISKGESMFAVFNHIEAAAKPVFKELAEEKFLVGLDARAFSQKAAHYLAEINALHPFREGNGRAQREFMNHVAAKSGYIIHWENAEPEEVLQATVESFNGKLERLTSLIEENLKKAKPETAKPAKKASPK